MAILHPERGYRFEPDRRSRAQIELDRRESEAIVAEGEARWRRIRSRERRAKLWRLTGNLLIVLIYLAGLMLAAAMVAKIFLAN